MIDVKEIINKEIDELKVTKNLDITVKNAEINGFYAGAEKALKVVLNKIIEAERNEVLEQTANSEKSNTEEPQKPENKKNSK